MGFNSGFKGLKCRTIVMFMQYKPSGTRGLIYTFKSPNMLTYNMLYFNSPHVSPICFRRRDGKGIQSVLYKECKLFNIKPTDVCVHKNCVCSVHSNSFLNSKLKNYVAWKTFLPIEEIIQFN